jgi:hypothetical protein
MPTFRESHSGYLIQATAARLPGKLWQPRLMMTRMVEGAAYGKSQSFPGLTPEFDTAKGAARFAATLGHQLAEEHSSRLTI